MPSGWPQEVRPPGTAGWEATAVAWLLGLAPEYRQYDVLRRHPVVLAFIARHVLNGAIEGARQGYRTIRSELGEVVPTRRGRRRAQRLPHGRKVGSRVSFSSSVPIAVHLALRDWRERPTAVLCCCTGTKEVSLGVRNLPLKWGWS